MKPQVFIQYDRVKFKIGCQTFEITHSENREHLEWMKAQLDKAFTRLENDNKIELAGIQDGGKCEKHNQQLKQANERIMELEYWNKAYKESLTIANEMLAKYGHYKEYMD